MNRHRAAYFSLWAATLAMATVPVLAQDVPAPADTAAPAAEVAPPVDFTPQEYGIERYELISQKSPFEFELPVEELPPEPNPFEGISLTGYTGKDDKMTVFLFNAATGQKLTVYGEASPRKVKDESGMTIVSLNRTKNRMTTTVTLRKGSREEAIGFDVKALSMARASGGAAGGGGSGIPRQQAGIPGQPPLPQAQPQLGQRPPQAYRPPQAVVPSSGRGGQGGQAGGGNNGGQFNAGGQGAGGNIGGQVNANIPQPGGGNLGNGNGQSNLGIPNNPAGNGINDITGGNTNVGGLPSGPTPTRRRVVLPTAAPTPPGNAPVIPNNPNEANP